jgi:hypothetical protein
MCGHTDLGNDIEPEIRSTLPNQARREVIEVERDDVHRVKAHCLRFVQQRQVAFGEGFAKQEGVDAEFHG